MCFFCVPTIFLLEKNEIPEETAVESLNKIANIPS